MKGAREYAKLFKTGQHGRLYFVSSDHARGKTFRIYVLPEGEAAIPNGSGNAPLNSGSVEVYGAVSGQLGWTETYGWIHKGKWVDDFNAMVEKRKKQLEEKNNRREEEFKEKQNQEREKVNAILNSY